jgi:hypothetical protein
MVGETGKPSQTECLGGQAKVLKHHALLDAGEFGHHQLNMLHRRDAAMLWIIFQMSPSAARKSA